MEVWPYVQQDGESEETAGPGHEDPGRISCGGGGWYVGCPRSIVSDISISTNPPHESSHAQCTRGRALSRENEHCATTRTRHRGNIAGHRHAGSQTTHLCVQASKSILWCRSLDTVCGEKLASTGHGRAQRWRIRTWRYRGREYLADKIRSCSPDLDRVGVVLSPWLCKGFYSPTRRCIRLDAANPWPVLCQNDHARSETV